jgi:cell division protein FtsI (penicillin-binding protein 3)
MLEGVVEKEGTAPRAKMEEFRVAGKTGTAQKADPIARGYSDKRIASFIGIVPAEAPRAVILVIIDEPKTDVFGGVAAAPAFKEIATGAMPYLGASPSRRDSLVQTVATPAGYPQASSPSFRAPADPPATAEITGHIGRGKVAVPDVGGRSGREAIASLLAVSLEPRLSGMGRVVSQQPASGSLVEKGTRVRVELATRQ